MIAAARIPDQSKHTSAFELRSEMNRLERNGSSQVNGVPRSRTTRTDRSRLVRSSCPEIKMPKEIRRKTSKEVGLSGAGINELLGSRSLSERNKTSRVIKSPADICDELALKTGQVVCRGGASPSLHSNLTGDRGALVGTATVMEVQRQVPQVTISTPEEGGGCSREMQQEDLDDMVDGELRRKLSTSSISSTGSSVGPGDQSEDDMLSDNESKSKGIIVLEHLVDSGGEQSNPWWKLKTIVHFASQRRRLNWVQLAGHKGNFKAADEGNILKRFSENEKQCFERLRGDALLPFVPGYLGVVERDGEAFIHMTDLLVNFDHPNVMDCKMGVRTYLEEELVRARERPKLRKDLYEKMVEVDSEAPTAQEHMQRAVTKPRYMQWRETLSSTHTLGFRIEGIKMCDGTCRTDFKKTRSKEDVAKVFTDFVGGNINIIDSYLSRLAEIQRALQMSEFFKRHEVIGSSLLFIHDHTGRAQVWLIDFGKTTALPEGQVLNHGIAWQEGNREDGYLWGLENLVNTLGTVNTAETGQGTCAVANSGASVMTRDTLSLSPT